MDLATKDLRRHAGRFAATVIGVGLLIAIVLIMNGMYRGNIADGVWLINHTDADLWVVERGRGGPFNEPSRLPQYHYRAVSAVPGVAQASPFIFYTVERAVAGKSQHFTIIGYDVLGGLGGPPKVRMGRGIQAPRYEIVADGKLGLLPGQRLPLGLHDYIPPEAERLLPVAMGADTNTINAELETDAAVAEDAARQARLDLLAAAGRFPGP